MEDMTQQLRAKGHSLEEAEGRCVQERARLEGEKEVLVGQLGVAKDELERTKNTLHEVMVR